MKIIEIYKKYNVPPNLQQHMLTVTAVTKIILDHWIGEEIDKVSIIKSALIHDLGNIVKFDFDRHPEFLGEEEENVEYWKDKQQEIIKKYGDDDHTATRMMLKELGFDDNSIEIVSSKSFANSVEVAKSNDLSLKILLYADLRVLPWGVGQLAERFGDIKERMPQYNTRPDLDDLFNAVISVEKQLQENVDFPLSSIDSRMIKIDNEEFLNMEI